MTTEEKVICFREQDKQSEQDANEQFLLSSFHHEDVSLLSAKAFPPGARLLLAFYYDDEQGVFFDQKASPLEMRGACTRHQLAIKVLRSKKIDDGFMVFGKHFDLRKESRKVLEMWQHRVQNSRE